MIIFNNNEKYIESVYEHEEQSYDNSIEKDIINNSKLIFGDSSIYINSKKKIDSKSFGGVIPDGFLIDLSDVNDPKFYLVEIELAKHSFFNHIFPQITKFFNFFKSNKSQNALIEKLYTIFETDKELSKELKSYIGNNEIYKFLKDLIESSKNILLIIDDNKPELPDIIETYTDTWGKLIKLLILKKYVNLKTLNYIFTLEPEFENIEYSNLFTQNKDIEEDSNSDIIISEEYHLQDLKDKAKNIYNKLKAKILEYNPNLVFNPQKYYISIREKKNIAFYKFENTNKIKMVLMISEENANNIINHYTIKSLSQSVQKFYNGESCQVFIDNDDNLDEIVQVIDYIIKS